MWREREAKRGQREKGRGRRRRDGEAESSRRAGRGAGVGWCTTVLPEHVPGGGQPRAGAPTAPGGEHGVSGVEVPDHYPAWAAVTLGLGTLLLPLSFQTLQHRRDPAGVWDKAAPHS